VSIPLLGTVEDLTASVVVGDGPLLSKAQIDGSVPVPPGSAIAFAVTATNPFDSTLSLVDVVDRLFFRATGASGESLVQTQTLTFGTLQPHESRTMVTTLSAPSAAGTLRNEVSASGSFAVSAGTIIDGSAPPPGGPRPMFNEIVLQPQKDWDDSGGGGDGIAFNAVPGSGTAPGPSVTAADQWIELWTNTGTPAELTNWTLSFTSSGGAPTTVTLGPANLRTVAGSRYVIFAPATGILPTSTLTLTDPAHQVVDTVSLAAAMAILGPATGAANEAIARTPDGIRTNSVTDFTRSPASIGGVNP
jgi:hypothetical protein